MNANIEKKLAICKLCMEFNEENKELEANFNYYRDFVSLYIWSKGREKILESYNWSDSIPDIQIIAALLEQKKDACTGE